MTNSLKPAAVLDDSPYSIFPIARSLRTFGGVDVEHYFSIPAFERTAGITNEPNQQQQRIESCAMALRQYSVVVCDNNFEDHVDPKHPYDGWTRGIDFLISTVGPALELIPPKERPLVVCYAPSNRETILHNREALEQMGIIAFMKTEEAGSVGIYTAVVREYGYAPSYYEFVHDILGFELDEMEWKERGQSFIFDLATKYIYSRSMFPDEDREVVAGPAKPIEWSILQAEIEENLGLKEGEFGRRIESVIQNHGQEGGTSLAFRK
ncbi:MAG: hypothetical protein WC489_06720 [Patescibacteria group bacterium]